MWAYVMDGPARLTRLDGVPEPEGSLAPGELRVRFKAGGICGSDLPNFAGKSGPARLKAAGTGFPIHELVAEVLESASDRFSIGDRVVGWAHEWRGLREYFTTPDDLLGLVPPDVPDADAAAIQPLGTVLHAISRLLETVDVSGRDVAVLGLGPIGLLFSHVLKHNGARHVTGVDHVDRNDVGSQFGIDEVVTATTAEWAAGIDPARAPTVTVEAIGHQTNTLAHAIQATAMHGHIYAFGVPDDEYYALPFRTLFRKHQTLYGGTTTNWPKAMGAAAEYLTKYRSDFDGYVSHTFPVEQAQTAFEVASVPAVGRLKVVITA